MDGSSDEKRLQLRREDRKEVDQWMDVVREVWKKGRMDG